MSNEFLAALQSQRLAFRNHPHPDYRQRSADLKTLARLINEQQEAIVAAINQDYGSRSDFETRFGEIFVLLDEIRVTRSRLKRWMRPQRRHLDITLYPTCSNRVLPQPLGVVGVIVPWNFPLGLALSPLIGIFAAGNRAMIKMSHKSAHLAALLIRVLPDYFPPEKLRIFSGGDGRGQQFAALPFDHLVFTGGVDTGRAVMAAAAANLTPLTLELGGKSPAVVAPDYPIKTAAERILWGKALNAGQVCTTMDYVFIPEGSDTAFTQAAQAVVAQRYPDINHPDYTSIIDEAAYQRLQHILDDAVAKGARIVNLFAGQTPNRSLRKFPLTLIFNPRDDMLVMQREIFGPLLPVLTYQQPQQVIDYAARRDRPLTFYLFSKNRKLQEHYLQHIPSGGAAINHVLLQSGQHDLPFGGIGASGMGQYHGYEGFLNFSKLRPVYQQGFYDPVQMMLPPYAKLADKLIRLFIRMRG